MLHGHLGLVPQLSQHCVISNKTRLYLRQRLSLNSSEKRLVVFRQDEIRESQMPVVVSLSIRSFSAGIPQPLSANIMFVHKLLFPCFLTQDLDITTMIAGTKKARQQRLNKVGA